MSLNKKNILMLALTATASVYTLAMTINLVGAQTTAPAQQAPAVAAQPVAADTAKVDPELDVLDSFSDGIYARRVQYFSTIKSDIAFKSDNMPEAIKIEYSETFRDFAEPTPRRTAWMMPTDTGWVSAGGADLYEVHLAVLNAAKNEKNGKMVYGPITISQTFTVDLKDHTKRVEAKFGNKILAFKSAENRDRYAELVAAGSVLELQDMQCAMAPVHPKRPHLAGATLMVVFATEHKGNNGQPLFVRTYNSAHVAASYNDDNCRVISNAAFRKLSDDGRTAAGASILVKQKRLDDMRVPAFTPINPIQNISCAPLS